MSHELLDAAGVLGSGRGVGSWVPYHAYGRVALHCVVPAVIVVPELVSVGAVAHTKGQSAVILQKAPPEQEGKAVCRPVVGVWNIGGCCLWIKDVIWL